jgi:hypothetical protein
MAGGGDFYDRDRPENPQLAEDRPRGGGPEDRPRSGGRLLVPMLIVAAVLVLILFFVFI